MHPLTFECTPPLPVRPYPIVVLGAGGIVKDAHLPAYRLAGFPVHSIANRSVARARALAEAFAIPRVFASIEEAVADGEHARLRPERGDAPLRLVVDRLMGLAEELDAAAEVAIDACERAGATNGARERPCAGAHLASSRPAETRETHKAAGAGASGTGRRTGASPSRRTTARPS
jgi:hypothetical protein